MARHESSLHPEYCTMTPARVLWSAVIGLSVSGVALGQARPSNSPAPAQAKTAVPPTKPAVTTTRVPMKPAATIRKDEFKLLDTNRDGEVGLAQELNPMQRARFGAALEKLDRNDDGRVDAAEFEAQGRESLLSSLEGVAALLLAIAFAAFCVLFDSLLDGERREYVWPAVGVAVLAIGAAYFCAPSWYLEEPPFLAYLLAIPALTLLAAFFTGAMKIVEVAPEVKAGELRHVIGKQVAKPTTGGTARPAPGPSAATRPAPARPAEGEGTASRPRPGIRPRTPPRPKPPPRTSNN